SKRDWSSVVCSSDLYNGNNTSFSGFHFLNIGNHFFISTVICSQNYNGHVFINQGNGAVFHFCGWISLGVDVRNFFQFQRTFQGRSEERSVGKDGTSQ